MNTDEIVRQLDAEIARLQQAHTVLAGGREGTSRSGIHGQRRMSAESKARIAAPQDKDGRW